MLNSLIIKQALILRQAIPYYNFIISILLTRQAIFTTAMGITIPTQFIPQTKRYLLFQGPMALIRLTTYIRAPMELQGKFRFILTMMQQKLVQAMPVRVGKILSQDRA